MAIGILGDIHGGFDVLARAVELCRTEDSNLFKTEAIIQVGDFGLSPFNYDFCKRLFEKTPPHIPVMFIDGNHEHFPYYNELTEVTEMFPNIFYVPRGTVLTIDNRKIAFLGGAESVDRKWRSYKVDWWPEENITDAELARLDHVDSVDILITHVPPISVIHAHFDRSVIQMFDLPKDWFDRSSEKVDRLWNRLNRPTLFCGHMHRFVRHDSATILDTNQFIHY